MGSVVSEAGQTSPSPLCLPEHWLALPPYHVCASYSLWQLPRMWATRVHSHLTRFRDLQSQCPASHHPLQMPCQQSSISQVEFFEHVRNCSQILSSDFENIADRLPD